MAKNTENSDNNTSLINHQVLYPLWLSISTAAKLCGVNNKTIRRAVLSHKIIYKIVNNRYFVEFPSLIKFMHSTKKLQNKLNQNGLGQYIAKWQK